MPKASDVKPNHIVEIDGKPCTIRSVDVRSPTARGAATLYKFVAASIPEKQKVEATCKGTDILGDVDYVRVDLQVLFNDGEFWHFMDNETFDQYQLTNGDLDETGKWLQDGMTVGGMLIDGFLASVALPSTIDCEVTDTMPSLKGSTAVKKPKPAVLANGVSVMVPDYIVNGEWVRIDPSEARFISRVTD